MEDKRVLDCSDTELIHAIRARGNDLRVLKAFAFLRRMFEQAALSRPREAPGLQLAAGLLMLYSKAFPSDPRDNPFPFPDLDQNMTVASLLQQPASEPMSPAPLNTVTQRARNPVNGMPVALQRPRGRPPGLAGGHKDSKMTQASQITLSIDGAFSVHDAFAKRPEGSPLLLTDFKNALYRLNSRQQIYATQHGRYIRVGELPAPVAHAAFVPPEPEIADAASQ